MLEKDIDDLKDELKETNEEIEEGRKNLNKYNKRSCIEYNPYYFFFFFK